MKEIWGGHTSILRITFFLWSSVKSRRNLASSAFKTLLYSVCSAPASIFSTELVVPSPSLRGVSVVIFKIHAKISYGEVRLEYGVGH